MKKKLFAIVGYTNWGKSNTLYELFERRQFFPLKAAISCKRFGINKFTVINASNEDSPTDRYLKRLKDVLLQKELIDTTFVITISLIFDNGKHDAIPVFNFLNAQTHLDICYIVLERGWQVDSILRDNDREQMKKSVTHGDIVILNNKIDKTSAKFTKRTIEISDLMKK